MTINQNNSLTWLKYAHWVGLFMLLVGLVLYFFTELSLQVSGMLWIASFIGLGLVAMSPFPVVLFIQWAQSQDSNLDK
ncbi:hypothetical protein [Shewanella gelidii]|uniref:Uncharacterized protein n=1 Tax=Shewanella gelidii TaxID=1642821 RepID=A0A917JP27_9GAMM|nr:hypothetical protein [Shewanella gelidii]MCL1097794.1 hypothetical protein [Shewanella gelidii]GGI78709.1 hypothetical protein GCM10009332_15140 [Shewanella gelidii]